MKNEASNGRGGPGAGGLQNFKSGEEDIRCDVEMAFNQEDLDNLYKSGAPAVYLVEGTFAVPADKLHLEYLTLGNPTVSVSGGALCQALAAPPPACCPDGLAPGEAPPARVASAPAGLPLPGGGPAASAPQQPAPPPPGGPGPVPGPAADVPGGPVVVSAQPIYRFVPLGSGGSWRLGSGYTSGSGSGSACGVAGYGIELI